MNELNTTTSVIEKRRKIKNSVYKIVYVTRKGFRKTNRKTIKIKLILRKNKR